MEQTARINKVARAITGNNDLLLVFAAIAVLFVILRPLPTFFMDILLIISIASSMLVLVTTIYVVRPLQFSVFPSLLLGLTLFRLALNVASTRLIFSNAPTMKDMAAGHVIQTFGQFVGGDNPVIGILIFAILVIIQFVVITKGATRISEVAARFTLDAMPGKQMAIDADLNSGLINEEQARQRRTDISREADFYGAMDGASKFVRGDAIAGIIIVLVNTVGGFVYGFIQGMGPAESAKTFTLLTIGDGLVSQVPALLVSVAAGLVVTRSTGESNLGEDVMSQLMSNPKVLYLTAGFLGIMLVTPLPKIPLLLLGGALIGFSRMLTEAKKVKTAEETAKKTGKKETRQPENVQGLLNVDPMELEVGYGLIRLVDANQGGDLLDRIQMIRRQMAVDFGLVVPPIRIRDNMQLQPNEYVAKIRGSEVARGTSMPDQFLAMDSGIATGPIEGTKTKEPAFGLTAYWISPNQKQRAEAMGYTVVDPTSVMATHLTEVVKDHADEILSRQETHALLDNLKQSSAKLVEEVVPDLLKVGDVQKVLQNLLRERVSIRNLGTILETLADYAPRTKDTTVLTEYVRNGLSREICKPYVENNGKLYVVTLDPRTEDTVASAVTESETGAYLSMSPAMLSQITGAVGKELEKLLTAGHQAVILVSPEIRPHVKRIADRIQPGIAVLSYNEIPKDVTVESMGVAALPQAQAVG